MRDLVAQTLLNGDEGAGLRLCHCGPPESAEHQAYNVTFRLVGTAGHRIAGGPVGDLADPAAS
ncbi:hypothetical protein GCM10010442_72870 [Kitasatospora kifunensis]